MKEFNKNSKNDEMSMEDILASIRRYVTSPDNDQQDKREEEQQQQQSVALPENYVENIIDLEESQVVVQAMEKPVLPDEKATEEPSEEMYSESPPETGIPTNPFGKLAKALKSYERHEKQDKQSSHLTIDEFLKSLSVPLIEKWLNNNLKQIVERKVDENIEKIKKDRLY